MANKEDEYKRLRKYLNKSIKGPNTDALLRSIALGPVHLINNVEAVNDSLYIVSAKNSFLDSRLGDKGVTRPAEVGLSDEVFREIGIEITNRKQVRDLLNQLLRITYGETFTRATSLSQESENYVLEDGDNLIISFDDKDPVEIFFESSQFQNINSATAQEVADAITKNLRKINSSGAAFAQEDGVSTKVSLISSTDGPSSSVKVLGGKAQNIFKFEEIRLTSGDSTTQWTLTQEPNGNIRATWSGGTDPSLGKIKVGDYVNIYGTSFNIVNRGTFNIVEAQGGSVNESYIEYENPNGIAEIATQGTDEAVLFYNPKRNTIISKERYATVFQTSPRTIEVFLPATTKIVRRARSGAAHIYEDNTPSNSGQEGPYSFDTEKGYVISETSATTTEELNVSSDSIITVDDSQEFPDSSGHLILNFGRSNEEGPIPYIARPSSQTIRINPSYKFQKEHDIGSDVTLLAQNSAIEISNDGTDYPFYLTDSIAGRIYTEQLVKEVVATGIVLIIYILYPNDIGLGNWGDDENSEKYYVWGTEDDLIG